MAYRFVSVCAINETATTANTKTAKHFRCSFLTENFCFSINTTVGKTKRKLSSDKTFFTNFYRARECCLVCEKTVKRQSYCKTLLSLKKTKASCEKNTANV